MSTRGTAKTIGTHNGTFHCDEALAVFLLQQTSRYRDAEVVRTRDSIILDKCTVVVDVGAVYDEQRQRFDHHQRGFEEVFGSGFHTKLSSAGLIYKHFGKEIISNYLSISDQQDWRVDVLYLKLYKEFVEGIDGVDNGVSQYPSELLPKYQLGTDLSSRVGWMNPAWNEAVDAETVDNRFRQASDLTGAEFLSRLRYYANAWLPARQIVVEAVRCRHDVDASGHIMLLQSFVPWKDHLFEIEIEQSVSKENSPVYVIYPDDAGDSWRIQAVPINSDSFVNRKSLPEAWRGLRDEILNDATGVSGCIFVHSSGFIGGNKTREGALKMAQLAIK